MGGMAVRQVPSRWWMDKFKVFQLEPFYSSLAWNSNVPPLGRSSFLLPVGRHPSVPLHCLHQHHRRRGLAYFLHLKLLGLELAQSCFNRPSWFQFPRVTSPRRRNTIRTQSQGERPFDRVVLCPFLLLWSRNWEFYPKGLKFSYVPRIHKSRTIMLFSPNNMLVLYLWILGKSKRIHHIVT